MFVWCWPVLAHEFVYRHMMFPFLIRPGVAMRHPATDNGATCCAPCGHAQHPGKGSGASRAQRIRRVLLLQAWPSRYIDLGHAAYMLPAWFRQVHGHTGIEHFMCCQRPQAPALNPHEPEC
eukprot:14120681-Alexandrium_andersonii.AAC.1